MNITQATREIYAICNEPGEYMDSSWWDRLGLSIWRDIYIEHELARPSIDVMIRRNFGITGPPPTQSPFKDEFFGSSERRFVLCVALGLWALRGGEYLFMKSYRDKLHQVLDSRAMKQLQCILPRQSIYEGLNPDDLTKVSIETASACMLNDKDPVLRLCCLLHPYPEKESPSITLTPILDKLIRMI